MSFESPFSDLAKETAAAIASITSPKKPMLEFLSPKEMQAYRPPEGAVLVGANHIVRGAVFVIGGAPGVGKSRASVALAVAGATGQSWFGLSVPRRFRTMIIQNENGRLRLSEEFFALPCDELDPWIRISPPPPSGIAFKEVSFRAELHCAIDSFKPDLILIDPWNAVATDDKARDYLETFNLIREVLPSGDAGPAIGIVAHTRKPKHDERANGRGLLNLLAGSYVLASVPRSVFVLQPASDDTEDARIVFTCCKNNDGPLGEQSAWKRRNGLFEPVNDFDWDSFRNPASAPGRVLITSEDLIEIFADGQRVLSKAEVVKMLMDNTGCEKSAAYNALKPNGRFAANLKTEGHPAKLRWMNH